MLLGESTVVNGGAVVTGDLHVPGKPTVQLNGTPTFGGVIEGTGSLCPNNYSVTLNANSSLHHLRTRATAAPLPQVEAPQASTGTRSITINNAVSAPTDWNTVRDLTLNGGAGTVVLPPGAYRNITANGQTSLRIGVANASTAAAYHIQSLTLNGQARLIVDGPVVLTLNNGVNLNGETGIAAHPEWLQLRLANGGVTLNGGATAHAMILAPCGTVIVNGGAALYGAVTCDRLRLNGGGLICWRGAGSGGGNHAPVANNAAVETDEDTPKDITLSGTDPDGDTLTFAIVTGPAHGTITQVGATCQYRPAQNFSGSDSFAFKVSDGQESSAVATINITVHSRNDVPEPRAGSEVVIEDTPTIIRLRATDAENDALTFSTPAQTLHGILQKYTGAGATAGDFIYTPAANNTLPDSFVFTVTDTAGATAQATVNITMTPVEDFPVATPFERTIAEDGELSLTLSGMDVDGQELEFEVTAGPSHGALTGSSPAFTYRPALNFNGADSFQYVARDSIGNVSEPATVTIHVTPVDDAPVAENGVLSVEEDAPLVFAFEATDVDGESLQYVILQAPAHGTLTGSGPTFVYTPADNYHGEDSIVFVAVDSADPVSLTSASATVQFHIGSKNDAPTAEPAAITTSEDDAVTIVLSGNDVDGDALTYTTPRPAEGTQTFHPTHGTLTETEDPRIWIYTPSENYSGNDEFTFRVTDPDGVTADAKVAITVTPKNDYPTVSAFAVDVNEDESLGITLSGSDVDDAELYFFIAAAPTHGTLTGTTPDFVYQPNPNYQGPDSFSYYALDAGGLESAPAVVSINIHPVNDAPIAQLAPVSLEEDSTVEIQLAATDLENDALTFPTISAPSFGELTLLSPGRYRYTPVANFHGTDTFTYTASDGQEESAPAVVTITVLPKNDAPIAESSSVSTNEDRPFSIHLVGSDVDGDALTFLEPARAPNFGTLLRDPVDPSRFIYTPAPDFHGADGFQFAVHDGQIASALATVTITVVPVNDAPAANAGADLAITAPALLTFQGSALDDAHPGTGPLAYAWSQVNGPGTVTFANPTSAQTTGSYSQAGTYVLRLTVSDGELSGTDEVQVVVAMPNRAPVVEAGSDQRLPEGSTVNLAGTVTDDGLPVSATVTSNWTKVSGPGLVTFESVSAPATTATFSTPGEYVLRLRASDTAYHAQDHVTITVIPANLAPVVNAGPDGQVPINTPFALNGTATDDGNPRGAGLTLSWSLVNGPGAATFADTNAAATSVQFSAPGIYHLRLSASDSVLTSADEITISVAPSANAAPIANAGPDQTLNSFRTAQLNGSAQDDGPTEQLTFAWSQINGPAGASIENVSAAGTPVEFTLPGIYGFRLTVSDGEFTSADDVAITVALQNKAPIVNAGFDQSVGQSGTITLSGEVTDDGLPVGGTMSLHWSKVSGPGTVTFGPTAARTTAMFSALGEYVLRLTANDGQVAASDDVKVSVICAPLPPPAGLVAIWRGNNNSHDVFSCHDGVALNGLAYTDGKVQRAFQLDGVDDRVMVSAINPPGAPSLNVGLGAGFSIELWIRPTSLTNLRPLAEWGNNGTEVHLFASTDGSGRLYANIVDTNGINHGFTATSPLTLNEWQHVALTFDKASGAARLFRNGVQIGQSTIANITPRTISDFYIGSRPLYPYSFAGGMDEVSLFNRALSAAELQSIYQAGACGKADGMPEGTPTLTVRAGADATVNYLHPVKLNGYVLHRGWSALKIDWSKTSGPGDVTFSSANTEAAAAQFSAPGTYVLRLQATAGTHTAFDELTVEVDASAYLHTIALQSGNGTSLDPLNRTTTNNGATWVPGILTGHPDWALIPGTSWIYGNAIANGVTRLRARFVLPPSFTNPSIQLQTHCDNGLRVILNGTEIGRVSVITDAYGQLIAENELYTFRNPPKPISSNNPALFQAGENILEFYTYNTFGPTGMDYKGTVTFTALPLPGNLPPQINAGSDLTIALPGTVSLAAVITDDAKPLPDLTALKWEKLSGPGTVAFSAPTLASTTATFSAAGEYHLQLTANDGQFQVQDTMTVLVVPPLAGPNQAPAVEAGPDFGGPALSGIELNALVVDDSRLLTLPDLRWSKVSGPGAVTFLDPIAAQTRAVVSLPGEYVFALSVFDGQYTTTDTITYFAGETTFTNQPPVAKAGPDRTVQLPNAKAALTGSISDDGFPANFPRVAHWEAISTGVEITNADQFNAEARFITAGDYTIRITVSDGLAFATDEMVVHVLPAAAPDPLNMAPMVSAGADLSPAGLGPVSLTGSVTDDGRPNGTLSVQWTKVSGPGTATFGNANTAQASVSFNAPGTYALRLTASDGLLSSSDDVQVTAGAGGNQPPIVNAGDDLAVPYGTTVALTPTIDDDGAPNGLLSAYWSIVSGPGAAQLTGTAEGVEATFGKVGIYTVRLTVSDGAITASDDVQITITGENLPAPVVAITAPASGATTPFGNTFTIVAQASQPVGGITGVAFYANGTKIGQDETAPYEIAWNPASAGTIALTAIATDAFGVTATSAPVSIVVTPPTPSVAVTQPPHGAAFAPGDSINIQAAVSAAGQSGAGSTVEFMVNGTVVGTDASAPFAASWAIPVGLGEYTLSARVTDASGQVATSAPVTIRAVANPNAAPVVTIGNLLGGETITAPQTITGTVEHPSLKDYRLEYHRKGAVCANWVTFASGTASVQNGTLGSFDPTVLLNGLYDIRLVARSAYGVEIADQVAVSVEGGMKVGLFTLAFNDLELPLAGMPITVTRIYDSREHCPGDFGHGWKLDVESIRLDWNAPIGSGWNLGITEGTLTRPPVYQLEDTASHMATVRMPDGEVLRFSPKVVFARDYNRLASVLDSDGDDVAQAWIPLGNSTPLRVIYRARGGTRGATLHSRGYRAGGISGATTVAGDATLVPGDPYGGQLLLATEDNTTLDSPIVSDVTGWELRLKDRRVFLFDDKGRLEQMTDANGNSLTVVRDAAGRVDRVTHSSGQRITFVRNAKGFVTEIADPKNAKLKYVYDSAGDLRGFYDRVTPLTAANPTQSFTYKAGTHYLEDLFDGKGIRASRSYYDAQGRLVRTVDADGKEVVLTHNVTGRTETIRDRTNRVTTHRYDERGNVVETISPDGTVQNTTYHVWSDGRKSDLKISESITGLFTDANAALVQKTLTTHYAYEDENPSTPPANDGLLRKVTDPMSHTTSFTYDDRGNALTITDALNRTTTNTYHPGTSLLATTTDAKGHVTSFTYDGRGLMDKETRTVTVKDEAGANQVQILVTDYDYNAAGHLTKLTDANNHATTYTYDANGNQLTATTTRTDENGAARTLVREQEYDDANRLVRSWDPMHPRSAGHQPASETIYDENGKPVVTYDAQRRATTSIYNARGELIRAEYADTTTESTAYDAEGRREYHTDRRGKVTQFLYDAVGRLAETRFLGSAGDTPVRLSSTIYDGAGRVYQSTDARNQTTTFAYDDAGRRIATINALNERTDTIYNEVGSARYFTDAKGNTVENVYDELNRKVRTVFAPTSVAESTNGTVRTTATETVTDYDELGRRVAEYEQSPVDRALTERRATRYIYDKLGRLSTVVQPEVDGTTPITRYTYNELGSQLTQTDALNHTTTYKYDDLGRRTGRQLPGGQSEAVTYFRSGAVKDRIDFNGTLTSYTYDNLNRLLSRTSNHNNAAASNVSFTYTVSGQRESMIDATGTTAYGYDHRDRLETKTTPQGTITYEYEDASGLLTGMHTNTPNGATANYTYDELSRLKTVSDVNQQSTTYGYDANGNLETVTLPNGVKSTYAYSDTNRLENLGIAKAGNTLAQFAYTLAATGHRYRSAETGSALQSGSPGTTRSRAWNYDALWRLRNETLSGGTALGNGQSMPNGSVQYALDAVGNRKSRTSSIAGLISQNFNFDSNDRVQGDPSDNNGNTLNGTVSQPSSTGTTGQDTYDAENRLIARNGMIATFPGSISIAYNGDGHKVAETTTRNGITTTVTHLVDELNPTGYARVIEEKSNGALSRVYLFGHDLISQDVANENTGQWELRYFGYDGHGSTRFLTNVIGAVTDTYEYDAFGELLAHTGTTQNRYRYCGEQYAEALGLYYLRARLMNPLTGRFWTMDRFEGSVREPAGLHKYTYASNDPITTSDPTGYAGLIDKMAAVAINAMVRATIMGAKATPVAYIVGDILIGLVDPGYAGNTGAGVIVQEIKLTIKQVTRAVELSKKVVGGVGAIFAVWFKLGNVLDTNLYRFLKAAAGYEINHLNQDAAFGRIIAYADGAATRLFGSATEFGSEHYRFHQILEGFWNQFRNGGPRVGKKPTCAEYDAALSRALEYAGKSTDEAEAMAYFARMNREAHGLGQASEVPDIPGVMTYIQAIVW